MSFGVLTLTDAGPHAGRVGLLPPWWVPLAAGSIALAALLPLIRRGIPAWPLALLLVTLVPWLPLPPAGVLVMWAGPLTIWAWIAAFAAWLSGPLSRRQAPRSPALAFLLALAVFGAAAWQLRGIRPGGDEPHYLVIVQSLLRDGDLRIENNHERKDYAAYFGGVIGPHFLTRGVDGQIYSVHAPGLPAVVAPAFALGGYQAVVGLLVVLSAIGTMLVWRITWRLTGDAGAAWFAWCASLAPPFFFHSYAVYPDALGSVLIATGVLALVQLETGGSISRLRWVLHGAALALLPWLHTRFVVASVVLGTCLALRLAITGDEVRAGRSARIRALAAFLAVPAIGAAAWFGFFRVIWGTFDPSAPYGTYTQTAVGNIARGLPGLLLDQQFGILPNAPVYLCAFAGFWALFRRRPRLASELSLLVGVYLAAVCSYHMWWGGWSAPARFAVPVMLTLGVVAGVYWSAARRAGRAAGVALLGFSLLITATMTMARGGRLIFNSRDGFARWLDYVAPNVDLPRALPSFFRDGRPLALAQATAWLVAFMAAYAALRLILHAFEARSRNDEFRRLVFATAPIAVLAVAAAVAAGWWIGGASALSPLAGQLALLDAYDPKALPIGMRQTGSLADLRDADRIPPTMRLRRQEARPRPPDDVMFAVGPLPAGAYRIAPDSIPTGCGAATVRLARGDRALATWDLTAAKRSDDAIELPAGAASLVIEGDEAARTTARGIALQPVTVTPSDARATSSHARHAGIYGPVLVYTFDDRAWLEGPGLWVRGGVAVPLMFSAPGARRLEVVLRNGPVPNRVEMDGGSWRADVALAAGEERPVEIPLRGLPPSALVRVKAERGFRPSETTSGNRDERYLGAWMEFRGTR